MSAIVDSHGTHHRLPRKPGKGRFSSRNVPKSKSLQTLETNLDDVFADECEPGALKKTPSEHELRVSNSLSKLNIPDWFRKSSFSRSNSTQSLFTYARTSSTSTIGSAAYPSLASSPSSSVTPGSHAVIIQKRVTPNSSISPSTRLLRAPMLPTTPERAPIHNTPPPAGLPSDKFRKQEKKELKPIAIVPFAKLREMFERKALDDAKAKQTATSPTKEKPSAKVRFEPGSPTKETLVDDRLNGHNPVQNDNVERTKSPPPTLPERKPILSHSVKNSESASQPRRTQVHFSDETNVSNRSQEQSSNTIRQNGAAPSTGSSKPKKPQGLRASLPMPQFRFRRPGMFAKQAAAAAQNSSSQSKKGFTMSLLPKDHHDFVKPEYWEKFFKRRGTKAFEWYGEYPELCGVLHKYIKSQDKILMVGCGNSQLSADLYDVGYNHIVNVDISDTVIRQMVEKNERQRPEMKFLKMDVLNMEFSDGDFSVVLDKGTLDALMVDNSDQVVADVEKMFSEIVRVTKLMGRYVCISLLQDHILHKVIQFFAERGWAVRIHRIHSEDSDNADKDFLMPVFALIFTKFKPNPKLPQILEICTTDEKFERFSTVDDLINVVKEIQYYAVIRQRISTKKMTEDQLSLSLYNNVTASPRYTLTIVDSESKLNNKFAIFIVPQGRETEWMFSTKPGREQLSKSAGFERLVVVTLDRNHTYTDLDSIQAELSAKVLELSPPDFKQGTKVPFLSLGNDIGSRKTCECGHSEMSGDYIVEELEGDGGVLLRRLVFLANQNIVQSEARLISVSKKKKGKGKQLSVIVDKSYLACQHHISMVAGLAWVQCEQFSSLIESSMSVLLVGLGGGGLPTFMHLVFPQISLNVVDIDPEMVTIATKWFGFTPDDKLKVHVANGINYIETAKDTKRHVIMLDVDSKDVTAGMSCPPQPFVQHNFLQIVKESLHPGGVFILNLVCRDEQLKKTVIQTVKNLFQNVFIKRIEDEVNEIVYAINSGDGITDKDFKRNCQYLNKCVRNKDKQGEMDLIELMESIKIVDV